VLACVCRLVFLHPLSPRHPGRHTVCCATQVHMRRATQVHTCVASTDKEPLGQMARHEGPPRPGTRPARWQASRATEVHDGWYNRGGRAVERVCDAREWVFVTCARRSRHVAWNAKRFSATSCRQRTHEHAGGSVLCGVGGWGCGTHNLRSELHEVSQVHVPLCGLRGWWVRSGGKLEPMKKVETRKQNKQTD
jgi:hypothetical protein